jgi:hypothetical protein
LIRQLADASVVLVLMVVLVLVVLMLICGVAVAIPLLGGLVMVGMGACWFGESRRQPTGHEQGQGDQPTAEQRGMHDGKRRPGNKSCRRWPDRIDGWAVLR